MRSKVSRDTVVCKFKIVNKYVSRDPMTDTTDMRLSRAGNRNLSPIDKKKLLCLAILTNCVKPYQDRLQGLKTR